MQIQISEVLSVRQPGVGCSQHCGNGLLLNCSSSVPQNVYTIRRSWSLLKTRSSGCDRGFDQVLYSPSRTVPISSATAQSRKPAPRISLKRALAAGLGGLLWLVSQTMVLNPASCVNFTDPRSWQSLLRKGPQTSRSRTACTRKEMANSGPPRRRSCVLIHRFSLRSLQGGRLRDES